MWLGTANATAAPATGASNDRSHYLLGDTHVTPAQAGAWRENPFSVAKRRRLLVRIISAPMTHEIPGVVRLEADSHGLSRFVVTNAQAEARIYLLGAQVTHFQPARQEPVLWLSPLSAFEAGKAIRGGVPICWPWFGPHPSRADLPEVLLGCPTFITPSAIETQARTQ